MIVNLKWMSTVTHFFHIGFSTATRNSEEESKTPYILVQGHMQTFLVVDRTIVCECEIEDVALVLISAFFSFNVCHTPGCHNYFARLEYIFLGSKSKLPASVKHLIASLENVS